MYVAPNVEGLVAAKDISRGAPIIEYTGSFTLASEAGSKIDPKTPHKQFLLNYSAMSEPIVVDSTKIGWC
jgi:hypothetical protein